jgi:hypothetical protein
LPCSWRTADLDSKPNSSAPKASPWLEYGSGARPQTSERRQLAGLHRPSSLSRQNASAPAPPSSLVRATLTLCTRGIPGVLKGCSCLRSLCSPCSSGVHPLYTAR